MSKESELLDELLKDLPKETQAKIKDAVIVEFQAGRLRKQHFSKEDIDEIMKNI